MKTLIQLELLVCSKLPHLRNKPRFTPTATATTNVFLTAGVWFFLHKKVTFFDIGKIHYPHNEAICMTTHRCGPASGATQRLQHIQWPVYLTEDWSHEVHCGWGGFLSFQWRGRCTTKSNVQLNTLGKAGTQPHRAEWAGAWSLLVPGRILQCNYVRPSPVTCSRCG